MKIKKYYLIGLAVIIFSGCKNSATLDLMKIVSDGQSVSSALYILSYTKGDLNIDNYKDLENDLNNRLKDLRKLGTGYIKDVLPMDFVINDTNKVEVLKICKEIENILELIRKRTQASKISPNQMWISNILISSNPGSYYECINYPTFNGLKSIFNKPLSLSNHPLNTKLEVVNFQEMNFKQDLAAYDTSLWEMWRHAPNLRVLHMTSSGVDNKTLDSLRLDQMYNLKVLLLGNNPIDRLPKGFENLEKLEYLDLSNTRVENLPDNLSKMSNLKFLRIRATMIDSREKDRIRNIIPNILIE